MTKNISSKVSKLAAAIQPSPIPGLAAEIDARISSGEQLYNLTIGDFDSEIFPIPDRLRDLIIEAYREGHTNYPGAKGMPALRQGARQLLERKTGAVYGDDEILIASGSRPLIYSAYLALIDPGDKVIFPTPSWNNDYYCDLSGAEQIMIPTSAENNFMPRAQDIAPHISDATLIALCSPLNPTGTVMDAQVLKDIGDMVITENRRRKGKPLYVLMDQVYWLLTFGGKKTDVITAICPELHPYTILSDGMSKAFAGTGVRVGWAFGPKDTIAKMRAIVAHMGAWAPKAEQIAAGRYLTETKSVDEYLENMCNTLASRLEGFHEGFSRLAARGLPIETIKPIASIYLSLRIGILGKTTPEGEILDTPDKVHRFLLNEAKTGLLPFSYFGSNDHPDWYRLSVGTVNGQDVTAAIASIDKAIASLK